MPALPAAALLITGAAIGSPMLEWVAVSVSIVTGIGLAAELGAMAARRLQASVADRRSASS